MRFSPIPLPYIRIAQLLYEQSNHPHIKSGELYVAYLTHITLDNTKVEAIGIFKSEMKQNFLQFEQGQSQLEILLEEGVNVNRLDKGCLIFNVNEEGGYKILSVDSNRYDTKYWTEQFLGIDVLADDAFFTKKYLKMCQDFAKEVVLPTEGKQEEILFMNRGGIYGSDSRISQLQRDQGKKILYRRRFFFPHCQ